MTLAGGLRWKDVGYAAIGALIVMAVALAVCKALSLVLGKPPSSSVGMVVGAPGLVVPFLMLSNWKNLSEDVRRLSLVGLGMGFFGQVLSITTRAFPTLIELPIVFVATTIACLGTVWIGKQLALEAEARGIREPQEV